MINQAAWGDIQLNNIQPFAGVSPFKKVYKPNNQVERTYDPSILTGTKHGVAQWRGGHTKFPIMQIAVKLVPQLLAAGGVNPEADKKWLETARAHNPQVRDRSVRCGFYHMTGLTGLFSIMYVTGLVFCHVTGPFSYHVTGLCC
jgi:hypothetical protein